MLHCRYKTPVVYTRDYGRTPLPCLACFKAKPALQQSLKKICVYGKNCTFGQGASQEPYNSLLIVCLRQTILLADFWGNLHIAALLQELVFMAGTWVSARAIASYKN